MKRIGREVGQRARHRASTVAQSIRRFFRRTGIAGALVATITAATITAIAGPAFAISAPTSISYDRDQNGFKVSGITMTDPPAYVQVSLTVVDSGGNPTDANGDFRISAATQCSPEASWLNPDTSNSVRISGDNSASLFISGDPVDVQAALGNIWLYRANSAFCGGNGTSTFTTDLGNYTLQVSAVESAPDLYFSPFANSYYKLVSNTQDDGMGQPTDVNGNLTSSNYFVSWSSARVQAKAMSINIGGGSHTGYLAAVLSRNEQIFLDNNVSRGDGITRPAWIGGSDNTHKGKWNWVDGPEASWYGGDTVGAQAGYTGTIAGQDYVQKGTNSDGQTFYLRPTGHLFFVSDNGNVFESSSFDPANWQYLIARDTSGAPVLDAFNVPLLVDTSPCNSSPMPPVGDARFTADESGFVTPSGAAIHCGYEFGLGYPYPWLEDGNGGTWNLTDPDLNGTWPMLDHLENYVLDSNGYIRQVVLADITRQTYFDPAAPNYDGYKFWGTNPPNPDSWLTSTCYIPGSVGDCWDYYSWSNWTNGDGLVPAQPDDSTAYGASGEDATMLNWCTRDDPSFVGAPGSQTLYGNPGYKCTSGWSDWPVDTWPNSSTSYSGTESSSPNQIGTTDFIVEFCGYESENWCGGAVQTAVISFVEPGTICPAGGNPNLSVSYAAPGVMATDLTSDSMTTENFNSLSIGSKDGQTVETAIGTFTGNWHADGDNWFGGDGNGSGGQGHYGVAGDSTGFTGTLKTTQRYIGFYWSAGDGINSVQLLDSSDRIVACFTGADLLADMGSKPAYYSNPNHTQDNTYFGTNPGQPYAYVHMRLPSGFQKIHFSSNAYIGAFEFDNISVSETVPGLSSSETNLNGTPPSNSMHTPSVVPVDPRASQARLPQLDISGSTDTTVCYRQVADAAGTALTSAATVNFGTVGSMQVELAGSYFAVYGTQSQVVTNTGGIVVGKNDYSRITQGGSIYIEVALLPTADVPTEALCNSATTRAIIAIRPLDLFEKLHRTIQLSH